MVSTKRQAQSEEARFCQWKDWLEEILKQVTELAILRHVYKTVQQITQKNLRLQGMPGLFHSWMATTYVHTISVGLRRLADKHRDTRSLYRLLSEIHQHPQVLSRERFLGHYQNLLSAEPSTIHDFNKNFDDLGGNGKPHIDPQSVQNDLDRLEQAYAKMKAFVDKQVVHLDREPPATLPSLQEVDECLDLIEELVHKYYTLLNGVTLMSVLPVFQYNWMEVFEIAWKPRNVRLTIEHEEQQRRLERMPDLQLPPDMQNRLNELIEKIEEGEPLTKAEEQELSLLGALADRLDYEKALLSKVPEE